MRVRDDASLLSEVIPLIGLHLNYRLTTHSHRLCLGHVPFRLSRDAYVECVNRPAVGARKCNRCAANDATFAANLHHAHTKDPDTLETSIAKHLDQANVAYIAAFRDGSMKVGTSTTGRHAERLAEQGAWLALTVASATDGIAIRKLEDQITHKLGVSQSVSGQRKVAGLANPRPDEVLLARLAELGADVAKLIPTLGDDRLQLSLNLWESPARGKALWKQLHAYPLDLRIGHHDLLVQGACGRIVAFSRRGSDDIFVADLGPLLGLELEIGDFTPDPVAVQEALF